MGSHIVIIDLLNYKISLYQDEYRGVIFVLLHKNDFIFIDTTDTKIYDLSL